jgi:hypothetical protein
VSSIDQVSPKHAVVTDLDGSFRYYAAPKSLDPSLCRKCNAAELTLGSVSLAICVLLVGSHYAHENVGVDQVFVLLALGALIPVIAWTQALVWRHGRLRKHSRLHRRTSFQLTGSISLMAPATWVPFSMLVLASLGLLISHPASSQPFTGTTTYLWMLCTASILTAQSVGVMYGEVLRRRISDLGTAPSIREFSDR